MIQSDVNQDKYVKERDNDRILVQVNIEMKNECPTSEVSRLNGFQIFQHIDDCVVVLVFEARGIPSRFGEVQLSLPISTLKSVAESVAEDVPAKEPHVDTEEANLQRALEESLKSMHDVPRGPLLPVVIREHEPGKYQPLPEVPGKGKAKVTEEQVAHDLLSLQKPKKKSLADQYIFQRRTSTHTGSSRHDESSYAELKQSNSEEESEKVVPGADAGGQGEGQARPDPGQAGPDPGNTEADEQPVPSPVVHAGSDREHMDLDVADVSPQPLTEQMNEGFTATACSKVQENLKLTVEEQVLLEEPASLSGTLSSLQHLSKDISFGDLFFCDKPSEADNDKATAETEVESMVPESPKVHQQLKATATETTTTTTTTTLPSPPYQQQQSTTEAMMMKCIDELEHIMANLIQENKGLEQRLDSQGARLYVLEQLNIPHQVSKAVNEVVTNVVDWAMQAPLRNRFKDLPEADMKEILHQRIGSTSSTQDLTLRSTCPMKSMLFDISRSDLDSPASKPTKTARKPKPTTPKAHPRPSVSKPVHGFVSKKCKPISASKSVDESVAEDVPAKEPRADDEEADVQMALEESMKSMYDVPWGPLPPVVIREPEPKK
nr:hypothetical protein [Tanacetum cinerariifolium]